MIVELVTCDQCDWSSEMTGSVVPATWIVFDGKHYCCLPCYVMGRDGEGE